MVAPPSKRDKRKYYHFHRDHRHDTKSCFQLKKELEKLLKMGFLDRYVKNDRGKERADKLPTNHPSWERVTNIISRETVAGQVLRWAKTRYSLIEQLVLELIVAIKKLRPYFQTYLVQVMANQPLKKIIHRPKTSGRLLKWAMEVTEFDIEFKPRTAIKPQALAYFIADLTALQAKRRRSIGRMENIC
ncbi:RT RNaseH 2 domain-containing protein [Abeliophyllum distichum]|uniref:RT RNaseH 2 domain-containing protein n=1 Tax=Abeliophyllum distichum TaxID=126358 RepID=A0ABD1PQU0_9LAMI